MSEGEGTDVGSEDNQGDTYCNDRAADFETMKGEGDEKADGKSGADDAEELAHEEEEDEDEMVKYMNGRMHVFRRKPKCGHAIQFAFKYMHL